MIENVHITVVIPTCNRPEMLRECLNCLTKGTHTYSSEGFHIIVSDDGKGDASRKMVESEFGEVKWVRGPGKGPACNRNHAVQYVNSPWIAFTDDDCLPVPGWLEAYANGIQQHKEIHVFEGKTVPDRPRQRYNEEAPINERGGALWSCNMVVRTEYFRKIGGFNEVFSFNMEDAEFHSRVKQDQQKIVFIEEAEICHPWRKARSLRKVYDSFRSVETLLQVRPDQKQYYKLWLRLKIWVVGFILSLKHGSTFRFQGLGYLLITQILELYLIFRLNIKMWLKII